MGATYDIGKNKEKAITRRARINSISLKNMGEDD